ncbi:MAG: amino acid transporter, partial [Candidatus Hydrothermarchaeaceae archaeon]
GSAGFWLICAVVNASNVRVYAKTHSQRWISALGVIVCLSALGALIWQTALIAPQKLWVLVAMVGLAFPIEAVYRILTGRVIRPLIKSTEDGKRK